MITNDRRSSQLQNYSLLFNVVTTIKMGGITFEAAHVAEGSIAKSALSNSTELKC